MRLSHAGITVRSVGGSVGCAPPSSLRGPVLKAPKLPSCLPQDRTGVSSRQFPFPLSFNPLAEHFRQTPQSYFCNSFVCQAGRFMAGICINIYTLRQGGFGGHAHTRTQALLPHPTQANRSQWMSDGHSMHTLNLKTHIQGWTGPRHRQTHVHTVTPLGRALCHLLTTNH